MIPSIPTLLHLLGRFHPAVVHFPIALISVAAVLEGWQLVRRKPTLAPATGVCVGLGALSGIVAALFGWLLANAQGDDGNLIQLHQWIGIASAAAAVLAAVLIPFANVSRHARLALRSIVFAGAALVGLTGYLGGEITSGPNHLTKGIFSAPEDKSGVPLAAEPASPKEAAPVVAGNIAFHAQVAPILKDHCLRCHCSQKAKGKLNLETRALAVKGGKNGEGIVAGKPENSLVYTRLVDDDADSRMPPPKEAQLSRDQIELIRRWIQEGAVWPENVAVGGH
jgi:uncharacterized membrane protein